MLFRSFRSRFPRMSIPLKRVKRSGTSPFLSLIEDWPILHFPCWKGTCQKIQVLMRQLFSLQSNSDRPSSFHISRDSARTYLALSSKKFPTSNGIQLARRVPTLRLMRLQPPLPPEALGFTLSNLASRIDPWTILSRSSIVETEVFNNPRIREPRFSLLKRRLRFLPAIFPA